MVGLPLGRGVPALDRPPADARFAAIELGAFLAGLHVRAPLDAPHNPHRGVPLADKRAGFEANLAKAGKLVDADQLWSAWTEVLATPAWTGPDVWLHGDMHPLNLLVHEGQFWGVIDFGDITAGDPASDLAVAWMLWPDRPEVRSVFRTMLPHDDATWERARGWALSLGLVIAVNSADRPTFAAMAHRTITAALTP
ncbi:MAG: phosphotransferase [Acidimicrobiales bacterium]